MIFYVLNDCVNLLYYTFFFKPHFDESWVTLHFIWSNTTQQNHKDQEKAMKNKQETSMSVMRT